MNRWECDFRLFRFSSRASLRREGFARCVVVVVLPVYCCSVAGRVDCHSEVGGANMGEVEADGEGRSGQVGRGDG